ncbi:hypothetical protein WH50_03325 [Pokkaliibacter plantistimulans]|uniref:Uncharacterized protein n=1 Tax=Pokkaliibacter plantistimulans TaxID=1635171 RepID=A0ABX5M2A8_9GAMM|nr:hypothetical protein [Pokkaliibacter plantistimulans]PXF32626.1 hypothetical protein WH50_03325 [Pokkaliibacter plantistimulans]
MEMKLWHHPRVVHVAQRSLTLTRKALIVVAILVGCMAAMLVLARFSMNHTAQLEHFSQWWSRLSPWLYLWRIPLYGISYWMWRTSHYYMVERHGAAKVRRFGWRAITIIAIVEVTRVIQITGITGGAA